jgi:hypothetical protein
MSLSPISLSTFNATGTQNSANSFRKDFRQLEQALSQGDLSSAQSAFSALTQSSANVPQSSPSSTSTNPLQQDLAAVGSALQSGDLTGAQSAFAKLQQDFKTQQASTGQTQGAHRHHGGHHHQSTEATTSTTSTTTTTSSGINVVG